MAAYFAPCDVRDAAAVEEFVRAAEKAVGQVSVLVDDGMPGTSRSCPDAPG